MFAQKSLASAGTQPAAGVASLARDAITKATSYQQDLSQLQQHVSNLQSQAATQAPNLVTNLQQVNANLTQHAQVTQQVQSQLLHFNAAVSTSPAAPQGLMGAFTNSLNPFLSTGPIGAIAGGPSGLLGGAGAGGLGGGGLGSQPSILTDMNQQQLQNA